jgi:hypothetical protein
MALDRRDFLVRSGGALAAAVLAPEALGRDAAPAAIAPVGWEGVRSQFRLRRDRVHLGAFLLASHPEPVRRSIDHHRRGLDADPVGYLHANWLPLEAQLPATPADARRTSRSPTARPWVSRSSTTASISARARRC